MAIYQTGPIGEGIQYGNSHHEGAAFVIAINGECFEISPHLWQQNQQQKDLLLRYFALPLKQNEQILWLGVDSLANLAAFETFSFLTGKIIEPVLLDNQHLKRHLQHLTPQISMIEEEAPAVTYHSDELNQLQEKNDEPVIHLLNQIFENALKYKASDIHLEPQAQGLRVRFRIDGVLQPQPNIHKTFTNRIISRLKLLAKLDISETRLPQDGRFHFKTTFSDILDFRLSTLPTNLGEKAVLRLQQNKPVQLSFAELGMTKSQQMQFQQALSQPQGLILVTGPTGSGKSISLYTALQWLNKQDKHIMTAEDPIEIELDGIIQTQINPQIGLDFSRLLRTFLRQDPDIIMLGEIRDEESAAMALRAAQTGHLVLSTLHTNDAISAISRLQQLGIRQHEIDSCLLLVIAQRLVRKLCTQCKKSQTDCHCYQGYDGRTGVYQFLQPHFVADAATDATHGANGINGRNLFSVQISYKTDFPTLFDSAQQKLHAGITDRAEIERALGQPIERE